MDTLDIRILGILRKNARMPFSELGKAVNLSTSAVVERVHKLEKAGVISRYAAIIDGKACQKELMALMFISLESPRFIENFLEFVRLENDIIECHYITGNYDYILKIITQNTSSLELILNKIKSRPGVIKTYTNVVLQTTKNEYSINPEP
jgi:Lrp/AsnC family leucine-responsive transcriptional regulator